MSAAARVSAGVRAAVRKGGAAQRAAALELTEAAVRQVKQLLASQPDSSALRVGVKTRGCNGLTYVLDYAKEKSRFDEEVLQDGARLFVDAKAQMSLLGAQMDFVEDKLSSQFVFNSPNIKGTCGCGESFNI